METKNESTLGEKIPIFEKEFDYLSLKSSLANGFASLYYCQENDIPLAEGDFQNLYYLLYKFNKLLDENLDSINLSEED